MGDLFILCRRSFVETMSCTTLYQTTRVVSNNGASLMFFHTVSQSTYGHCRAKRISGISDTMLYMRFLYACSDSVRLCRGTYAASTSKHLGYPSVSGLRSLKSGFLLSVCMCHLLIQSAVIFRGLCPCDLIRYGRSARHIASTFMRSHPSSSFPFWRVDRWTIKMSPFHRYRKIVVFSYLRLLSGGGNI